MLKKVFFVICNLSFVTLLILPSPVLAATLSLSPSKGTFNRSCSFSVDINLDTQGVETDGTDVILLYEPKTFTASSIINGSIYSDFPGNNIDNTIGKVSIYALAPTSKGFSGKGVLATVNFNVVDVAPTGPSTVNFDFNPKDPTKTTDSNVIERNSLKDVLTQVTNGSYNIGSGSCLDVATASASQKGGIGGPASSTLPKSGFTEPTIVIGTLGLLLSLAGFLGLRKTK